MKHIRVESVHDAFEYVMQHYYPPELEHLVERSDTYAVISIQDSNTGGFGVTFTENKYCKGVLTLLFDDIEREVEGEILFSEEMAEQILRFIKAHREVDTLLVHCYAGQSRSRAVGAFAVKLFGGDNSSYFTEYDPNAHVYRVLEETKARMDREEKAASLLAELFGSSAQTETSYTEDTIPELIRMLAAFCERSAAAAADEAALDQAQEVRDICGDIVSAMEEADTPETRQYIADCVEELRELIG